MDGGRHDQACAADGKPYAGGVEHTAAPPRADGGVPFPRKGAGAERRQVQDYEIRAFGRTDHRRKAGRGRHALHGGGDPQRGTDLPSLRPSVVRLLVGHQLFGQGRSTGSRRRPDVPRGDLRRSGAEGGAGARALDDDRRGQGCPESRGETAGDRALLVALQG